MKLLASYAIILGIIIFPLSAFAQSSWTGGVDNNWATAGNWNPSGQPGSSGATINSTATINLPGVDTTVGDLEIQGATVTLNATANNFTTTLFNVDDGAVLNLNIAGGGTVISTNLVNSSFVGRDGAAGTLNLTGGGTLAFTSTTLGSAVGLGGIGVLNQSGSTTLTADFFAIGADGNVSTPPSYPPNTTICTGGTGTYTISESANLNANTLGIGLGSGTGAGNVTGGSSPTLGILNINGGTVTVQDIFIGLNSVDSTSTVVDVTGRVNQTAGTATVSDVLDVGVSPGSVGSYSLSGTGTLTADTLIVGDNPGSTGSFTQSGGTLTINNTLEIGWNGGTGVFNYNGGALNIAGDVIMGDMGTFNPGAPGNSVNIGGSLDSTGTFILNTNGFNSNLIAVTGAADVSGANFHVVGFGNITDQTVLTSSSLTPGSLPTTYNGTGVLFTATVTQGSDPDTLVLNTTQLPTGTYAVTSNERSVSAAIDPMLTTTSSGVSPEFTPLAIALNNLTAAQIPGALDQLTPESLQYSRNIAFENSTFLAQQVDGFLATMRSGNSGLDTSGISLITPGFENGLGRSLGSLLAYNSPPYHNQSMPGDSSSQTISDSPNQLITSDRMSESDYGRKNISEFIGGSVVLADLNQNNNATNSSLGKASYTAGNATAGISFRMTSNLAAGVLMNYNHTDAKTDANGSKIKVDSYSPGLFGTYYKDGFYVNGLFSYGYNDYTNSRNIPFMGATAHSSPSGNQYVTNFDGGYDFRPEKHWIVGPTLGLTYTHLDVDSFNETGANAANLNVSSQSADSVRSRLGGHVVYQAHVGWVTLQPNFTAMWQHEYADNGSGITSQFNIPGSGAFTIQSAAPNRDSALLGFGVNMVVNNNMGLYLNYLADVGTDDFLAQSVEGGFKARF